MKIDMNSVVYFYTIIEMILSTIHKNQSLKSRNPITLLLFTDGKLAIKSSKASIWPVNIQLYMT